VQNVQIEFSREWFLLNKKLFVVVLCAVLLPVVFAAWQASRRVPIARTAGNFLGAVVSGDAERAGKLSAGSAAWRAKNAGQPVAAEVADIRISVPNVGRDWAEASAFVEFVLRDGSHDAGWYKLELVRKNGCKVASVSEATPWPSGLWSFAGKKDAQEAKETLASYLRNLAENRYQEAGKYLCGPARQAHEKGAGVLEKAPLFRRIESVNVAPVWRKGNIMVCQIGRAHV
jgi:hypothetical protein